MKTPRQSSVPYAGHFSAEETHAGDPVGEWQPLVPRESPSFPRRGGECCDVAGEHEQEEHDGERHGDCDGTGGVEEAEVWCGGVDGGGEVADAEEHCYEDDDTHGYIKDVAPPHATRYDEGCVFDFFGCRLHWYL